MIAEASRVADQRKDRTSETGNETAVRPANGREGGKAERTGLTEGETKKTRSFLVAAVIAVPLLSPFARSLDRRS